MAKREDDFPIAVKRELAARVGLCCSRPDCDQVTSAPHSSGKTAVNVGVASHITAARKGGPRYDPSLTSAQRKAIDNGIWLCQTCGKLVDADESDHTVELLREWKVEAELRRYQELRGVSDNQAQRRRRLNQFGIVACDVGGGRTVRLAWQGPLEDLETLPPRVFTASELPAIHCALSKYDSEPVQPTWQYNRHSVPCNVVWEINEATTQRWKLRQLLICATRRTS